MFFALYFDFPSVNISQDKRPSAKMREPGADLYTPSAVRSLRCRRRGLQEENKKGSVPCRLNSHPIAR